MGRTFCGSTHEAGQIFIEQYAEEKALDSIYRIIGTSVSSEESVPAASVLLLLADGDPKKCAELCANIGGDTDTMAAMAVGICGAMSEDENLFHFRDIDLIEKVNGLNFDQWTDKIMACMQFKNGEIQSYHWLAVEIGNIH